MAGLHRSKNAFYLGFERDGWLDEYWMDYYYLLMVL